MSMELMDMYMGYFPFTEAGLHHALEDLNLTDDCIQRDINEWRQYLAKAARSPPGPPKDADDTSTDNDETTTDDGTSAASGEPGRTEFEADAQEYWLDEQFAAAAAWDDALGYGSDVD